MSTTAKLVLEDGTVFTGRSFGARGEVDGEVCFNTSMTGYQEILTDPSYRGQIVTMTYPHIGNYGTNQLDRESLRPHLAGFVVREYSQHHSNFRAEQPLDQYLKEWNIVAIEGIDTRALVRRIRTQGAMKGVLSTENLDDGRLRDEARSSPGLVGRDLVREVVPDEIRTWREPLLAWGPAPRHAGRVSSSASSGDGTAPHIVAMDYGMKWNIARHLVDAGCRVTVAPGTSTADQIRALEPDGVFLSNGPGDPEPVDYATCAIRDLLGEVPIFGICLGHQVLARACGARTFKMKFGHRGANQPVRDLDTGRIEITAQNHGFAVDEATLPEDLEVTHRSLNDGTIEGIRHRRHPAFSVQYHPEASAGPHDSRYLFGRFRDMVRPGERR